MQALLFCSPSSGGRISADLRTLRFQEGYYYDGVEDCAVEKAREARVVRRPKSKTKRARLRVKHAPIPKYACVY